MGNFCSVSKNGVQVSVDSDALGIHEKGTITLGDVLAVVVPMLSPEHKTLVDNIIDVGKVAQQFQQATTTAEKVEAVRQGLVETFDLVKDVKGVGMHDTLALLVHAMEPRIDASIASIGSSALPDETETTVPATEQKVESTTVESSLVKSSPIESKSEELASTVDAAIEKVLERSLTLPRSRLATLIAQAFQDALKPLVPSQILIDVPQPVAFVAQRNEEPKVHQLREIIKIMNETGGRAFLLEVQPSMTNETLLFVISHLIRAGWTVSVEGDDIVVESALIEALMEPTNSTASSSPVDEVQK